MEVHQESRGRSHSRYPSEPRKTYNNTDPTKAATKRLFSNRSRISDRESEHGEICEAEEDDDENQHSGKRRRASDWPLTTTTTTMNTDSPPARAPLRNRNAPNSPSSYRRPSSSQAQARHNSSQTRPSKFLEGSMNDRASDKPPTTYIGDEEFIERYERENADSWGRKLARPKTLMHHANASTVVGSSTDRAEVSRHSGIFRFGKTLAASFNPSNWKIFSKTPEEVEDPQQKILRERREKAEAMYQELKKTGQFRESTFGPTLFQHEEEKKKKEEEPLPTKHDSGVEFGSRRSTSRAGPMSMSRETSREDKRRGRIFLEPPQLPTGGESQFSPSPASTTQDSSSVRTANSKFHFKKPSLSNIRKSISDIASDVSAASDHHQHQQQAQARRVPSRKDLQKQQKLVKRVSDLEGKLEAARRHLAQSMDMDMDMDEPFPIPIPSGPPPRVVRPRFVPGAMPSLPSERLLFAGRGHADAGMSESISVSQIGKAVTMDDAVVYGERSILYRERFDSEQPDLEEPTRPAPPPPDFNDSLSEEPESPAHGSAMQSVKVKKEEDDEDEVQEEEESLEIDDSPAESEQVLVQSVNSARQVDVIQQSAGSQLSSTHGSDLTDLDAYSEYDPSESAKHETSPEPSEIQPSEPQPPKPRASKPAKRKNFADDSGVFKTAPDSESDISLVRPKRTPNKKGASNSRKLQKTSNNTTTSASTKTSPLNERRRRQQLARGGKKAAITGDSNRVSKNKTPTNTTKGRQNQQSASSLPPPSSAQSPSTGLEYTNPSPQPNRNTAAADARMATYGAVPGYGEGEGEDEVPPVPKMPKVVRLASGEVLHIPSRKGHQGRGQDEVEGDRGQMQRARGGGSKLTKSRPAPSPKKGKEMGMGKEGSGSERMTNANANVNANASSSPMKGEDFEWPEDVF